MNKSFSKAHIESRHPHGVDPDDPSLFGHSAPSGTDATRRERQRDGEPSRAPTRSCARHQKCC